MHRIAPYNKELSVLMLSLRNLPPELCFSSFSMSQNQLEPVKTQISGPHLHICWFRMSGWVQDFSFWEVPRQCWCCWSRDHTLRTITVNISINRHRLIWQTALLRQPSNVVSLLAKWGKICITWLRSLAPSPNVLWNLCVIIGYYKALPGRPPRGSALCTAVSAQPEHYSFQERVTFKDWGLQLPPAHMHDCFPSPGAPIYCLGLDTSLPFESPFHCCLPFSLSLAYGSIEGRGFRLGAPFAHG